MYTMLNLTTVDKILCGLEAQAARIAFPLDNYQPYIDLCELVTAVDFRGAATFSEKATIYHQLMSLSELLAPGYNLVSWYIEHR